MKLKIQLCIFSLMLPVFAAQAQQLTPTLTPSQGGTMRNGNLVLTYTVGQLPTQVMQVNNLVLTPGFQQPIKPLPPLAPVSQTVCSDTPVTFSFSYIKPGNGGSKIEWANNAAFAGSNFITFYTGINFTVAPGNTDTIWLRSVDLTDSVKSNAVITIAKVNWQPFSPTPPAPQTVNSDTAYTFHFVNLSPGNFGNQLEWSLDSNFTTSYYMTCWDTVIGGKYSSNCSISVKVSQNSDTLIWLRSVDSVTGCVSATTTTIGIVTNIYQRGTINFDSIIIICSGDSASIGIPASRDTIKYALRIGSAVVNQALGNNSTLYLNTHQVNGNTIFNILATDTPSGDTSTLGFGILVQALAPVDTHVLITGDTFVYVLDTVCYQAIANNGTRVVYQIVSGSAVVDSLTGCVTSMTSDFTLQATVYGPNGCSSSTATMAVQVSHVAPPVAPAPVLVYIDSPTQVTTITLPAIAAGIGGDEIEFAYNKNFTGSVIYAAPASISLTVHGLSDTLFWLRSVSSRSGQHSPGVKSSAATTLPTLSAGLLDKTNWVLDTTNSDEFNYNVNSGEADSIVYPDGTYMTHNHPEFLNQWNLVFTWAPGNANYADSGLYNNFGDGSNQVFDWGECPENPNPCHTGHGCGHEVGFTSSGTALFTATKLDSAHHLRSVNIVWDSTVHNWVYDTLRSIVYYQSGMLSSVHGFPITNCMFEMRAKLPDNPGDIDQRTGFWLYTADGDYTIIDGGFPNKINNAVGDDPLGSCNQQMVKETPCNYAQDWHTYTIVVAPTEVIYFIDGKETWSTKFSNVDSINKRWPEDIYSGSQKIAPIMIGLGAYDWSYGDSMKPYWPESYNLEVDYFRYYTPKTPLDTTNPGKQVFQNLSSGQAQTLESLSNPPGSFITPVDTPAANNSVLSIANNNGGPTHYVANARIAYTNEPGLQKIYYAGTDGGCYNAYYQSGAWYEYPLVSWVADVAGGITVDKDRVYYTSTHGELKFFQWVSNLNQWVNFGTGVEAFSLNVDELGRVFYIGDSGVMVWCPTSADIGQQFSVVNDPEAWAGLVVHNCGCLLFYENSDGALHQHSWWNTWRDQGVITSDIVSANMVMDEVNSRLFFTAADGDIHSFTWDYNNPNPAGFAKLGYATCSNNALYLSHLDAANMDAQGMIALNNSRDIVYFIGIDGNIWSYFNDGDHGAGSYPVSPNWYQTPIGFLTPGAAVTPGGSYLAVEPYGNGRLFYIGADQVIHLVGWENADNPSDCPRMAFNNDTGDAGAKALHNTTTGITNMDSVNGIQVLVFPNPSRSTFTFSVSGISAPGSIDIKIYDINGSLTAEIKDAVQTGVSQNLTWDAKNVSSGIYYYQAKTGNGEIATNKLVKM